MNNLICPGYVSNMTSANCTGDVQINSGEFAAVLFFGMFLILGCVLFGLYIRKNFATLDQDVSEVKDEDK